MKSEPSIRRLPPELVAHIFINSLTHPRHPKKNEAPLNISSVCTRWRQIAISTPAIWSSISITFRRGSLPFAYPSILKNWISRSCNHGFSFTLTWEYQKYAVGAIDLDPSIVASIDVLVENCVKWRNISVDAYEDITDLTTRLLAVIPERTKQLRQIAIVAPEFAIASLFTSPLNNLTHLSVSTDCDFTAFQNNVPMESLVSLSIQADILDVTEVISRAPRLQQAKFYLKLYSDEEYPTEPITLPDLHTLDLDVEGGGFDDVEVVDVRLCRFLAYLRLPALKTLFVDLGYIGDMVMETVHWGGIVDLLSRSGATLHNLEIRTNDTASLPQFLEANQSLKHFAITNNLLSEDNQLIDRLIDDPDSITCCHTQLCPNLESLRITCHEYSSVEDAMTEICSFINVSAGEGQIHARPLVLVVPSVTWESLSLPSGSCLEIVQDDDWVARRQHDIYEKIGAHW
ncbi:hypothetical protein BD410DRAFT_807245 [Rickenella mellea]|uniref:F-box domain-containing protein n=1 Tax=Rickenella mellea TaxID=50990 RepID=A0A4Y7PQY9_9AGAM|nr:hypothetical protein BD410DRAFT_807245 [Rickenella mellea]